MRDRIKLVGRHALNYVVFGGGCYVAAVATIATSRMFHLPWQAEDAALFVTAGAIGFWLGGKAMAVTLARREAQRLAELIAMHNASQAAQQPVGAHDG